MFGALFNKEEMVNSSIQDSLKEFATELGVDYKSLFVMIKPANENYEPHLLLYKNVNGSAPEFVRQISIDEIV